MLDILVVDDEPGIRCGVAYMLSDAGHRVLEASDGAEALHLASERVFDIVFCDVRLPKIDGLNLFRRVHHDSPRTAFVLMTAFGTVADAKAALREGAFDYVTKPFKLSEFPLGIVKRIEEELGLSEARDQAQSDLSGMQTQFIGRSPAAVRLLDRINTFAQSDAPVLITGESGTGKELIARSLHERSARAHKPFVALHCAALPETLIEAELFGHEKGAFTGAIRKRDGRFKMADGGTLLLDEVGEISLSAQVKLLRVLQEGTIEPVGSSESISVDVRIIAATHQNLKECIAGGSFREDLYYRLNVLDLKVPPLRERPGDLALLLEYFLLKFKPEGNAVPNLTHRAWKVLSNYPFPGNVRELAHAIERAVVLSRGGDIDAEHLPSDLVGSGSYTTASEANFKSLSMATKQFERDHIVQALRLSAGKRGRAADLLGISRKTLWEKMRTHELAQEDKDDTGPVVVLDDDDD